jgi:pSer/pThr/pTyr-binding forkhead associated (FHA) protein
MIVKTVGRGPGNNFVINDENVSRVHLQLIQDENGRISVVDLGSTNGTYVNGNRITSETRLNAGDTLRIGDTLIPWQTYFPKEQTPVPPQPPKRKPIWWLVGGCVLLVLLIIGGVLYYLNDKEETSQEMIEQQMTNKQIMDEMGEKYLKANDEKRKAELDAEAEKQKRVEEGRRHVAEKKAVEKKKQESDSKAKEANSKALKAKSEADSTKKALASLTKEIQAKDSIVNENKKATAKAEEDKKNAEKEAELTKIFYQQLYKAKDEGRLKSVCEALNITDTKKDEVRYKKIEDKFLKLADNESRNKMIEKIKSVK